MESYSNEQINLYEEISFRQRECQITSFLEALYKKNNVIVNDNVDINMDVDNNDDDSGDNEEIWIAEIRRDDGSLDNDNNNASDRKFNDSIMKVLFDVMNLPRDGDVFNLDHLLATEPRLEKTFTDEKNHFVNSGFRSYRFNRSCAHTDDELHEKAKDFKHLIRRCGSILRILNVEAYPFSRIMPFINENCPNITELLLQFKATKSRNFKYAFYNLSHLEILSINWACKNLTLPLTLVKAFEQVGRTLTELRLSCNKQDELCLPDSMALVFPRLFVLKKLNLINFGLSQAIIQSIGEMRSLVHLKFLCSWVNNHPDFVKKIDMYPIGNLQYLETLDINYDCIITSAFLVNLCINAEKLTHLELIGKNITVNGIIALDNLKELKSLKLVFNSLEENNKITDQSFQYLTLEKLEELHISNCINISDHSVIDLFKNLPNLKILYIRNTKVTFEVVQHILEVTKNYGKPIYIYVSFKDRDNTFKSSALSGVIFKSNCNTRKYIKILK